ncbi:hypothetical protein [uncultured Helicobacter sp.]|nr:hypothetical protein [uncultured Helicobacter sp.]
MDSANAESQADSTIAKVAKHDFATIKLNRTKCLHLKRCRVGDT